MVKILSAALLGAALAGCGTVTETVYLQGLDAVGNVPSPPLFVTDSMTAGQLQFSARVAGLAATNGLLTGKIPLAGPRFPDSIYQYPSHNLSWSIPKASGGLDVQVAISRSVALTGGIATGQTNGSSLLDWSLGLGLIGAQPGQDIAVRLDAGVHGQATHIVAPSVAVIRSEPLFGSPSQTVEYFVDEMEKTNFDLYAALTFNSRVKAWPVSVFLQGGYNRCTLASFEPEHIVFPLFLGMYEYKRVKTDYRVSVWSVAPGLYFRLSEEVRVLAGARCVITDVDDARMNSFWMPFVQVDLIAR
jgi:hypothetical protein